LRREKTSFFLSAIVLWGACFSFFFSPTRVRGRSRAKNRIMTDQLQPKFYYR
jgi:hypothetical protein